MTLLSILLLVCVSCRPASESEGVEETNSDASSALQSHTWSDEKVAAEARRFILESEGSETDMAVMQELLHARPRTHATALALLKDDRYYQKLMEFSVMDRLTTAWLLTDDPKDEESIHAMARFFKDEKSTVRYVAALLITLCENEAAVPYIQEALKDSDKDVVNSVLVGIQKRVEQDTINEKTRQTLYPYVQALVEQSNTYEDSAKVLYLLDEKKAVEFFLSPTALSPTSPSLKRILAVMAENQIKLDSGRLRELISRLEKASSGISEREGDAIQQALILLGQNKSADDLSFLQEREAYEALLWYHDLQDYPKHLQTAEKEIGYAALHEIQRQILALDQLCYLAGDLDSYFSRIDAAQFNDAVSGLDAIGLPEGAAIIRELLAGFGPTGPSADLSARKQQMLELNKNRVSITEREQEFFNFKPRLQIAIMRYVLTNKDKLAK